MRIDRFYWKSERVRGIEPLSHPWKGRVEPFNYTREWIRIIHYTKTPTLSECPDSDRGPPRPKRGALPTEPHSVCRGEDSNLHEPNGSRALKALASTIPPPRQDTQSKLILYYKDVLIKMKLNYFLMPTVITTSYFEESSKRSDLDSRSYVFPRSFLTSVNTWLGIPSLRATIVFSKS